MIMIYGATGFTGRLICSEAARRGLRPILAGRTEHSLQKVAAEYDFDWVRVSLDDVQALTEAVGKAELVIHAAGPYSRTAEPMLRACLAAGTHYIDLSGEVVSHELVHALNDGAMRRGICLMAGAGFDVVPSDCLAAYVAAKLPGATTLELASDAATQPSSGTLRTIVEGAALGGIVRRNGELTGITLGSGVRRITFSHGEQTALPTPAAELTCAYRTTGIENITIYSALPDTSPLLVHVAARSLHRLASIAPVRSALKGIAGQVASGPSEEMMGQNRAYLWARASDEVGRFAEAWLDTIDPYWLTSLLAIDIATRILEHPTPGSHTPSQLFGADYILGFPAVRRYDSLEKVVSTSEQEEQGYEGV